MDENNKISETLDGYTPKLSQTEKDALWAKIDTRVGNSTPTLSPYLFIFNKKMHMVPITLALMLVLGTTGVVAASETARPGDSLFAVEQKVEGFRLALASDEKRAELEAQFASERLVELKSIIDESVEKDDRSVSASSTNSFEADVFADTTIVEVELNDRKTIFETEANTREEVVVEIMSRFGVTRAEVESSLDFEVEDRESKEEDKDNLTISGKNEVRVNEAVAITLEYVLNGEFDDDTRETFLLELSTLLDGVPVKINSERMRIQDKNAWIEIRNEDDDNGRIEIRDDENRIRIQEKDGEIRIDTRLNTGDIFEDSSDDDSNNSSNKRSLEAEADVFADTTIVEVELNDRKTIFETEANTREEVVVEIMSRFGVTRAEVESSLDFEVEDRKSRGEDTDDDSSDDDSNDDDNDHLLDVRGNLQLNVGDDNRD